MNTARMIELDQQVTRMIAERNTWLALANTATREADRDRCECVADDIEEEIAAIEERIADLRESVLKLR